MLQFLFFYPEKNNCPETPSSLFSHYVSFLPSDSSYSRKTDSKRLMSQNPGRNHLHLNQLLGSFLEVLSANHLLNLDNTHASIPNRMVFRFFVSKFPSDGSLVNSQTFDAPTHSQSLISAEPTQLGFDTSSFLFPCLLLCVTEKLQRDTRHSRLHDHIHMFGTLWPPSRCSFKS